MGMRKRLDVRMALALATLLAAVLAGAAAYAAEPIGIISLFSGEVTISRPGYSPVRATLNENVYLGDVIQTGPGAKVRLSFSDGSLLSLAERSRIRLDEYVYSPPGGTRSVLSRLFVGKVKCLVSRLSGLTRNRFEMVTPTAVVGTRGTIFVVAYDEQTQLTQVFCLDDAVQVENLNVPGVRITLNENLWVVFGPREVPPTPQPISRPQLQQLLKELAIGGQKGGAAATRKEGAASGQAGSQTEGSLAGGLESPGPAPAGDFQVGLKSPSPGLMGGPSPVPAGVPPLPPYVTMEGVLNQPLTPLPSPPPPPGP